MSKTILIILLLFALPFSYSHAGCLKPSGDFYVHLSTSPIVPVANEQNSFLFSFGGNNGLISNVSGTITIIKHDKTVLEHKFSTSDGLYGLKHTFAEPGVYEIYTEFNYNGTAYFPDDFVLEVIEKNEPKTQKFNNFSIIFLLGGIVIGVLLSKMIRRRK